jgi:hypothetical protein
MHPVISGLPFDHRIKLLFGIPKYACLITRERWMELNIILAGRGHYRSAERERILSAWKDRCRFSSNRDLPIMNLAAGLGDNRQIRFTEENKRFILLEPVILGQERWTMEELSDLMDAFRLMVDDFIGSKDFCLAEMVITKYLGG